MEKTSYKPGQFSWVDLMSRDVDKSKKFYSGLFGWQTKDQHDPDGNYVYTEFHKDDKQVAGMGGMTDEMKASPMPGACR
jgi:predicted enzyme related to lactoylglutathione lyase